MLKWGIDNSSWKSAIQELGKLLDQQTQKAKQATDQAKKALDDQKQRVKDLAESHKGLTRENQLLAAQSLQLINQQHKNAQAEIQAKLAGEKLVTAEWQRQAAALRLQQQQQRASGAGGRGGRGNGAGGENSSPFGRFFFEGLSGAGGSKLAGTITAANLATEAFNRALGLVEESLHKVFEEGDKLANIRNLNYLRERAKFRQIT